MYPHPELNSYLQGYGEHLPKKILNHMVDKAMYDFNTNAIIYETKTDVMRLHTEQPRCFGPHVDVTRAKCAFGRFALPKLKRELHSDDPLVVRQAITTIGDLVVNPEKLIEAAELHMPDRLSELLTAEDPYLRERAAMAFATMAGQAAGREAILRNIATLSNLSKGLSDPLAFVRLPVAQTLHTLATDYCSAEMLCKCRFVETITEKLDKEKKNILIVLLETLKLLLYRNVKAKAVEGGTFEKLVALLERKDESVLCKTLVCLRVLCEDICGKEKANDMELLKTLKCLLKDERESVQIEACRVASFVTITTAGKLCALQLGLTSKLLRLASNTKCRCSGELVLPIIKLLTNIAEAPDGRKKLASDSCFSAVEGLEVGNSEVLQRHKQTLIDVILWKP